MPTPPNPFWARPSEKGKVQEPITVPALAFYPTGSAIPKVGVLTFHDFENNTAGANGGAIFFSTHVLDVAEKLCDKIAIIKNGKLIRSGTMEEVKGDDSLEEVFLELEEGNV